MSELVEFLQARISEDEADALAIQNCEWFNGVESDAETQVLRLADPDRVLAECEAKRRIIERAEEVTQDWLGSFSEWNYTAAELDSFIGQSDDLGHSILLALAQPYRDHPDFKPEWVI